MTRTALDWEQRKERLNENGCRSSWETAFGCWISVHQHLNCIQWLRITVAVQFDSLVYVGTSVWCKFPDLEMAVVAGSLGSGSTSSPHPLITRKQCPRYRHSLRYNQQYWLLFATNCRYFEHVYFSDRFHLTIRFHSSFHSLHRSF